jgi:phosphohistidine swiveling domain-containing protein
MLTSADDLLNQGAGSVSASWSRVNVSEAISGVQTPMSWSVWLMCSEEAFRRAYTRLLLLPQRVRRPASSPDEQFTASFHGRAASNMEMMNWAFSALGGSGSVARKEIFAESAHSGRLQPASALRCMIVRIWVRMYMWFVPRRILKLREEARERWRGITCLGETDRGRASGLLREAMRIFVDESAEQLALSTAVIPRLTSNLQYWARRAGDANLYVELIGGLGATEEMDMTNALREVGSGRLSMDEFIERHGFHGPCEGELSSLSWREDTQPLQRFLSALGEKRTKADAHTSLDEAAARREAAERAVLEALPPKDRSRARRDFRLARRFIPLRTVNKAAFTQSFDLIRAIVRRIGVLLASEEMLEHAEDVFFLTVPEVLELPAAPRELVALRKLQRQAYLEVEVPLAWVGVPAVGARGSAEGSADDSYKRRDLMGIGASPGIVEGPAQVFALNSNPGEMEPGSVLVCHTTDPSWAPTMMLASAIVVDVGGMLSHGAIVARELGIPCVVNTVRGTTLLRSGERLRVDGGKGTVTVLV